MAVDFDALRQQVLQPVSALNPVGNDCRLGDAFDGLKTRMQALDSLESAVEPDWQSLFNDALSLLSNTSKDSLVLCWLAYALSRLEGTAGVVSACLLLGEAVTAFGDRLWPGRKRKRALVLAFEWLAQRWVAEHEQAELPVTEICVAQCKVVGEWLAEMDAPGDHAWYQWSAVVSAAHKSRMERAVQGAEKTPIIPDAPQDVGGNMGRGSDARPAGQPTNSSSLIQAPVTGGIDSAEALVKAQRSGQAFIESYCQYLRQRKLTDPMPYQLSRGFAFGGVVQLPPSREGQTELRPIPDEKRIRLEQLKQDMDWPAYIDELERSLFRLPFWLTGHRYVAEALEKTGPEGQSTARLLQLLCSAWVARHKALETLCFRDGSPFADALTQEWLSQVDTPQASGAGGTGKTMLSDEHASEEAVSENALAAMDLPDALSVLADQGSRLSSPLQRLHNWLRQGELARKRGKSNLASAIGRGVVRQLETHTAGQFLQAERIRALELVAQAPQDVPAELAELSLYQPQVAYRLINQSH